MCCPNIVRVCVCVVTPLSLQSQQLICMLLVQDSWRVFCLTLACEFPDVFVQFGSSSLSNHLTWWITRWIQEASWALKESSGQILALSSINTHDIILEASTTFYCSNVQKPSVWHGDNLCTVNTLVQTAYAYMSLWDISNCRYINGQQLLVNYHWQLCVSKIIHKVKPVCKANRNCI